MIRVASFEFLVSPILLPDLVQQALFIFGLVVRDLLGLFRVFDEPPWSLRGVDVGTLSPEVGVAAEAQFRRLAFTSAPLCRVRRFFVVKLCSKRCSLYIGFL